ncbi:nuclear transport factor 2 family protein [Candidatus Poriferisocius sp.]|uniref:nuclear transport factor 2 family protein n=1 Tax=Candidatus Poriferisocius sp. TaxID=3101276 RepID=UPI003B013661
MQSTLEAAVDQIAITDLCARYALHLSRRELDEIVALFVPDGEYHAFGETYPMKAFPGLIESAPQGQLMVNPPVVELDGDEATGEQHYVFVNQQTHELRLAWYSDRYRRTGGGWRFVSRSTTFLRRHGGADGGNTHDPVQPASG